MSCLSCGVNFKKDDEKSRCDECWSWYHDQCAFPESSSRNEVFVCQKCMINRQQRNREFLALQTLMANQSKLIEELTNQKSSTEIFVKRESLRTLTKFDGKDLKEFPAFLKLYEETAKEGEFSDLENANRLLEALDGQPLKMVKGLLTNPSNLPAALETLKQFFGNKDRIYQLFVNDVLSAKPPRDGKRETFIEFSVKVATLVSNIEIMEMKSRLEDPRLISDMLEKLAINQQERWIEFSMTRNASNLIDFNEFLQKRVKILQQVRVPEQRTEQASGSKMKQGRVHVQCDGNPSNSQKPCVICHSTHHKIEKCPDFESLSVNARWEKVKRLHLCFGCLEKARHRLPECGRAKTCGIDGCHHKHHKLLHATFTRNQSPVREKEPPKVDPPPPPIKSPKKQPVSGSNLNVGSTSQSMFMIVPVSVTANGKSFDEFAFLDNGSAFTLLDAGLAKQLNLKGTPEPFEMICAKGSVVVEEKSIRTSLKISARDTAKQFTLQDARTVVNLGLPEGSIDAVKCKESFPHLKGLPLPTFQHAKPRILIGVNNPQLLSHHRTVEGQAGDPIAVKTKLGWCVFGGAGNESNCVGLTFESHDQKAADDQLHELVKKQFTTESFGVKPMQDSKKSLEEERVQKIVDRTLKCIGDRYEIGLMWKSDDVILPDSYNMAYNRLLYIEKKMKKDPDIAQWYVNQINDYIKKGYCRKLTEEEAAIKPPKTWYIPYFHVINANKIPPKIRMVFDAAAKVGDVSLNSALLSGPNSYVSLPGVIFKSREGSVCVAADIREMFPQVKIREADQCAQRFLWREGDQSRKPDVLVSTSMIFGATCSPYAAQVVKNENAKKFAKKYPEAVDAIINLHYVDDYLNSHNSVEEAIRIAKDVVKIHKHAGYELRNFMSNSPEVMNELPSSVELLKEVASDLEHYDVTEKVLGVYWNIRQDVYQIKLNLKKIPAEILSFERPPTKRELLRIVMTIFDPVGLLSHALIRPRILIQETWRSKIGWDEPLSEILFRKWIDWFVKFRELSDMTIPRAYSYNVLAAQRIELHTFVDASEMAFACVIYFRLVFENHVEIALVTSKARVAPNKVLSIPRLELQAAVLGCRLAAFVKAEHRLEIASQFYWSDSKTALAWILSPDPQRFKTFVAVRVGEIQDLSSPDEWRKVPTKLNVADDATKWTDETVYSTQSRWFCGPEFLLKPETEWPDVDAKTLPEPLETRQPVYVMTQSDLSLAAVPVEQFSNYNKALKVLAYVVKFASEARKKRDAAAKLETLNLVRQKHIKLPVLSVVDLNAAENLMIKRAQWDVYPTEYHALLNDQTISSKSPLYPLSPMMDDNKIIRINSRIKRVPNLPMEVAVPAILPNKHPVTNLIVKRHHEKFAHQFQESVIASLRRKYWIVHVRTAVRRVKSMCQVCRNSKAKPKPTLMAELPICRLDWGKKPFTHTGVDLFGPLDACLFRRRLSCYGMLFTCMVTRAIHLELVMSLSADDCIMNVRNFLNRRGPIAHLYSDNATNFHGSDNELYKELQSMTPELAKANEEYFFEWHFNPPSGSHFGGAYERLIQSVKKALNVVLKEQCPRVETLRSFLIEVENIINARPLTHVPIESVEDDPLTPNHFLKLHSNQMPPPGEFSKEDLNLRKQWRVTQQLANSFWKQWVEQYLPELSRRTKWHEVAPEIEEGDIVLIVDNSAHRNDWKKGKVVQLIPGNDKICRVAIVSSNNKLYTRPIMKLAKLDVRDKSNEN